MPVVIRELNIKVSVSQNPQEQSSEQNATVAGQPMPDKESVVTECVEQIMEIMQNKNER